MIIGIIRTTDGGKQLLLDYFNRNYHDLIYEAKNRSDKNLKSFLEINNNETSNNFFENLVLIFECETFDLIFSKITKHRLKELFRKLTEKEHILSVISGGAFKTFGDKGIYLTRDVRVRWAVTQHRWDGVEGYARLLKNEFQDFENLQDKSQIKVLRIEDIFENQELLFDEIRTFFNLPKRPHVKPTEYFNKWIPKIDLKNIGMYVEGGKILKQAELDYLSKEFQSYHKQYGYPESLSISEIYEGVNNA